MAEKSHIFKDYLAGCSLHDRLPSLGACGTAGARDMEVSEVKRGRAGVDET